MAKEKVLFDKKTEAAIRRKGGRSKVIVFFGGMFEKPIVVSKDSLKKRKTRSKGWIPDPIVGFGDPKMVGH